MRLATLPIAWIVTCGSLRAFLTCKLGITKFRVLQKNLTWTKDFFRFFTKVSIFTKISISYENVDFLRNFRFLTRNSIFTKVSVSVFDENYDFSENIDFTGKIEPFSWEWFSIVLTIGLLRRYLINKAVLSLTGFVRFLCHFALLLKIYRLWKWAFLDGCISKKFFSGNKEYFSANQKNFSGT